MHSDVEVTDAEGSHRPRVSQVFCSALPIAYTRVPLVHWKPFALLVLEAAYEATLLAAVLNKQRGCRTLFYSHILVEEPLATRKTGSPLPSGEH